MTFQKERIDVNQDRPSLIIEAPPPPQIANTKMLMFSTYEKVNNKFSDSDYFHILHVVGG